MQPPEKKLDTKTKLAYGAGVGYAVQDQLFNLWVLRFYAPPKDMGQWLIPPHLITIAMVFSRITDAVYDPLVAYLSDASENPRGRRIPFIAWGAIPLAVCMVLFFTPPVGVRSDLNFIYLSMVGTLFFLFYTVVGAPYNALIPEISRTFEERVDLSTYQAVFRLFYTAIVMIGSGLMVDRMGMVGMAVAFSLISLVGMYATVFGVDEKGYSRGKPAQLPIIKSVTMALRNKAFIPYLMGLFFFWAGFNCVRLSMIYFVTELMLKSEAFLAVPGGALMLFSMLAFGPLNLAAKRFGNRKVMLVSALGVAASTGAMFFIGAGLEPILGGVVLMALAGLAIAGPAFVFPQAMLSDISKYDAAITGLDREGMFFGVQGFFLKAAAAFPMLVLPMLFARYGNTAANPMGIRLTAIISSVAALISFIFYYFYPEEEVLAVLNEERRGK